MLITITASHKRNVTDKNNTIMYCINPVQLLNSEYMQLNY